jgi:hypothetical protein
MDLAVRPQPMHSLRSTASWIRDLPRYIGLWLFVSSLSAGCGIWGNNTVKVRILFTDANPTHRLTDVSVIVGSDKFFWHNIVAGIVETVTLRLGARDDRQMTLLYTLNGQQKSWDSPKFDVGRGYRIEIKIDAHGTVAYHHCLLPCRLH